DAEGAAESPRFVPQERQAGAPHQPRGGAPSRADRERRATLASPRRDHGLGETRERPVRAAARRPSERRHDEPLPREHRRRAQGALQETLRLNLSPPLRRTDKKTKGVHLREPASGTTWCK